MNLVIDSGNSGIKFAMFQSSEIQTIQRINHNKLDELKIFIRKFKPQSCILSDTSGLISENVIKDMGFRLFVSMQKSPLLPIRITYSTPETLGKDRIAAAAGAFGFLSGNTKSSIIIDMGTCITMDVLENGVNFTGGNISPGIKMRLKSMHHFTGRLPDVQADLPDNEIGFSTESAMQNGAIRGACMEIDSFIRLMKHKFGKINVILTGGDASFFADFSKNKIFALPNLVLEGLNLILNYNAEKI